MPFAFVESCRCVPLDTVIAAVDTGLFEICRDGDGEDTFPSASIAAAEGT